MKFSLLAAPLALLALATPAMGSEPDIVAFGHSWHGMQIAGPDALGRYLSDPDREKANRALQAMLKMKKIIVADLDKAAAS